MFKVDKSCSKAFNPELEYNFDKTKFYKDCKEKIKQQQSPQQQQPRQQPPQPPQQPRQP
jgi:hypothetical protein